MMKQTKTKSTVLAVALATGLVAMSACSKTETAATSAAADANLSSLPSASGMTATNSSALLSRNAVTGTAPLMTTLKAGAIASPSVFWGDLLSTITTDYTAGGISSTDKMTYMGQYYGSTVGGPGGEGACRMAQSVGEAIGRLISAGNSRCYMQGISDTVTTGITVTSGSVAQGDLFKQTASNRMIKVTVSGMPDDGDGGGMDVFMNVYGSDTVGSDVYQVKMHFCSGSTVTGSETITINKTSGLVTMSGGDSTSDSLGSSTVTASIKKSGSDYVWDTSKDRTASTFYRGSWGTFKSDLTITSANQMTNKMYNSGTYGTNKVYSISEFSGSSLATLRFLQAGFKGEGTCANCGGTSQAFTFSGGTEWQTSAYISANNDMKTTAEAHNLATDSFYTSLTDPTVDLTPYSCSVAVDSAVTMNFSDANVAAIRTSCEADRFSDYDTCDQSSLRTIQGYLY